MTGSFENTPGQRGAERSPCARGPTTMAHPACGAAMDEPLALLDDPAPFARRLTLNLPAKRNPLSNALRGELYAALDAADRDVTVRVTILRGAGPCFSAGYDLSRDGARQALP